MRTKESKWTEIRNDFIDDNGFCSIDAWTKLEDDTGDGKIIAYVDMWSGRVLYTDPDAMTDPLANEVIQKVVAKAKAEHPYSIEDLEDVVRRVADFEAEEIEAIGYDTTLLNLDAFGIPQEMAIFFGFPSEE